MSTLTVSEELGRKLERVASSQGLTADELAAEDLERDVVTHDCVGGVEHWKPIWNR